MLSPGHISNLETLVRAAQNGDLGLMECTLIATGETVAVLCAHNLDPDGTITMVPFGHLATENPYDLYTPPI